MLAQRLMSLVLRFLAPAQKDRTGACPCFVRLCYFQSPTLSFLFPPLSPVQRIRYASRYPFTLVISSAPPRVICPRRAGCLRCRAACCAVSESHTVVYTQQAPILLSSFPISPLVSFTATYTSLHLCILYSFPRLHICSLAPYPLPNAFYRPKQTSSHPTRRRFNAAPTSRDGARSFSVVESGLLTRTSFPPFPPSRCSAYPPHSPCSNTTTHIL
ncbi:hypothetical protein C8J57DRAFT_68803 [Mycena rebaudengoi]|nr:hypothetical protein C8J57DRAFT_68803 [Mycena rebaudengoi]